MREILEVREDDIKYFKSNFLEKIISSVLLFLNARICPNF